MLSQLFLGRVCPILKWTRTTRSKAVRIVSVE
ncbi:unnamed protein product [Nippostrongylus brasiliensis]|uniref:Uncharacterized protein n=1 Tax=Nippostrongylus brasiliensis TaxID=27835 RepID=A0A0N4XFS2_NIPBR|nr:unnamed protein product [Nippostrongylus brasiliensis]